MANKVERNVTVFGGFLLLGALSIMTHQLWCAEPWHAAAMLVPSWVGWRLIH